MSTLCADPLLGRDPRRARRPKHGRRRSGYGRVPRAGERTALPARRAGLRLATQGAAAAAALEVAAAPAVVSPWILPHLSPEIPRTLAVRLPSRGAPDLAEALLAEGMLQEADWDGDMTRSIRRGLVRWAREVLGGRDLARCEWGLYWTDDIYAESGLNPELWARSGKGRKPGEAVGVVGLMGQPAETDTYATFRDPVVGKTALELEAARPGLGFQIVRMLQDALPMTLCVACPFWAWQQACKAAMLRAIHGSVNSNLIFPTHDVLPEDLLSVIPWAVCEGELRPGVIKEARRHPLPEHLRPIVELACEVLELLKLPADAKQWDTHTLCAPRQTMCVDSPGVAMVEAPFSLRWSNADPLPRIVDDWHYQIRRNDDGTNMAWCQGWQQSNPRGIRRVVRNWKLAATLALRACQLAELMHSDESPDPAVAIAQAEPALRMIQQALEAAGEVADLQASAQREQMRQLLKGRR